MDDILMARVAVVRPLEAEFRRGWPAVLACFCVAVFAWGFGFYGQAVFLAELHRMHDATGSYDSVLLVCMALQVAAAGLMLGYRHRKAEA